LNRQQSTSISRKHLPENRKNGEREKSGLSGSFGQSVCAISQVRSAKQASIVLFMFKHCFHWIFQIGFVCAEYHCPLVRWVRLAHAQPSRALGRLPSGDGSIRRVRLAKTPCAVSRGLRPNSQHRVGHVQTLFSL